MSLLTNARQYSLVAVVDIVFGDVPSAVAVPVLDLPQGAVVTAIDLIVDTVFDDTGAATLSIGDASSATRYATTIDIESLGLAASVDPTGFETTSSEPQISVVGAGNFDSTAGALRLIVEYVVSGRHNENFGDGLEFQGSS